MRKWYLWICFLVMGLLVFVPGLRADDKGMDSSATQKEIKVNLKTGIHAIGVQGDDEKVGEYDVLDRGVAPDVTLDTSIAVDGDKFISFGGTYWDDDDNSGYLNADIQRIFEENLEYSRFYHRLIHDQLKNFNGIQRYATYDPGAPPNPEVPGETGDVALHKHIWVTHDDVDVGQDYYLRHSLVESKSKLRLPFFPGAEVRFEYRKEKRWGQRQVMALSKCSSCHVVAMGRDIDEETVDYRPGIRLRFGNANTALLTLDYSFLYRTFKEHASTPKNWYDEVVHPNGEHVPVGYDPYTNPSVPDPGHIFDDRVQYQNGKLPFNKIPESNRYSHSIKADLWLNKLATEAFAGYVYTNVENDDTDNEWDLNTVNVRITNLTIPNLSISVRYRWLDIDNDDQYVDTVEPRQPDWTDELGAKSPMPGMTYAEYYHYEPDFTRKSALNRTVNQVNIDARYQLGRHITLRGSYQWKQIDRDDWPKHNYIPDEEYMDWKTIENKVKLSLNARFRPLRARISYTHTHNSDVITNFNAAGEALHKVNFVWDDPLGIGGPFHPRWNTDMQYPQRQALRTKDLSGVAEDSDEISAQVAWHIKPRLTLYAFYKWVDQDNDYGWDYQAHMPSIALDFAPIPTLVFRISYLYYWQKYDTKVCLPVFDG